MPGSSWEYNVELTRPPVLSDESPSRRSFPLASPAHLLHIILHRNALRRRIGGICEGFRRVDSTRTEWPEKNDNGTLAVSERLRDHLRPLAPQGGDDQRNLTETHRKPAASQGLITSRIMEQDTSVPPRSGCNMHGHSVGRRHLPASVGDIVLIWTHRARFE